MQNNFTWYFMPADRQSSARYNDHSENLQYNGILNVMSFM